MFDNKLLCGSLIGLCQISFDHPFDTLKTMKQSGNHNNNLITLFKDTYTNYGIKGFYRGYFTRLPNVIVTKSIVFSSTYHYDKIFNNQYISGSLAGATSTIFTCPLDNFKVNLQDNHNITMKQLFINKSYYKGFKMLFIRDLFGYGILFGTFDFLTYNNCYTPIAGALSGITCYAFTLPFDRIKTLNQIHTQHFTFSSIFNNEGVKGFYKGALPTMIKTSVGQAVSLSIYKFLF